MEFDETKNPIDDATKIKELEEKLKKYNDMVVNLSKELSAERYVDKLLRKKSTEILRLRKKLKKQSRCIKEKDEVLDDIAEELRFSKSREEELIETVKDYLSQLDAKDEKLSSMKLLCENYREQLDGLNKENEELRRKLADMVVCNVNEHALKGAESALVYKESYIGKLKSKLKDRDRKIRLLEIKSSCYKDILKSFFNEK